MKKKHLNHRQLRRIRSKQDEYVARTEREGGTDDSNARDDPNPEQQGLVISHYGRQLDVEALEGDRRGEVLRCHQRTNLAPCVAGDRIVWRAGDPTGVVVARLPRTSVLERPDSAGQTRPVAANIGSVIIVIAPEPEPFANLIDRYLVAAEHGGLKPVLLLNKSDLCDAGGNTALDELLAVYSRIGYPTLKVSARTGDGMEWLRELLRDRISIFVGQSGVGKSALVSALLPGESARVGEMSAGKAKGRHTTTAARLYHFPEGGDLIDSPGIREFHMMHMAPEDIIRGFVEFRPYLGHCRFRDCSHGGEPGCALLDAVEKGLIDSRRMESCRHILQSQDQK